VRALLAKQNKDLFEKIRQEAMTNTEVLQKFKDYDAQSHKDKVTAAQSVADLRVSYFHYVRVSRSIRQRTKLISLPLLFSNRTFFFRFLTRASFRPA
jgi:hypothetical protein